MVNREPDMNTRRDFLKGAGAATGIVFCSCGLRDAAWAQEGGGQRLAVMVNGKRVKTIDVHAHCHFREAVALMGDEASRVLRQTRGAQDNFIVIEERLKGMDTQAIDMEVLSINPFWYRKDRDTAAQIVKVQNEKLAELCASRPDRFAAFASLALQYPDLAVQQLETAMKTQGLRGAAIGGSVLGEDFFRTQVPPGVGKGGGAWSSAVHSPPKHAGFGKPLQGQRLAVEHDRQPARHDHRPTALDL